MKSIRRGKILISVMLIMFLAGLVALVFKVVNNADFYMSNSYQQALGKIYSADDDILYDENASKDNYAENQFLDIGNLIGDDSGQMSNTLINYNREKIVNYSFLTGVDHDGKAAAYTSLYHNVNRAVYDVLGSNNGTVIAYNYKTGEIYSCFSKPSVNILDGYDNIANFPDGSLLCKAFYGGVPGSTQKISTLAAALESMGYDKLMSKTYTCTGSWTNKNGDTIKCHLSSGHGEENAAQAFANSCNSWFAQLVADPDFPLDDLIAEYQKMGYAVNEDNIDDYIDIDGIQSFKASTTLTDKQDFTTEWGAIGQGKTLVSPCQEMIWQSAIANRTGKVTDPFLIKKATNVRGKTTYTSETKIGDNEIFSAETAGHLYDIMVENGQNNYSYAIGYPVGVKSGTAEIGDVDTKENSLLTGFCTQENLPVAFCVVVEDWQSTGLQAQTVVATLLSQLDAAINN